MFSRKPEPELKDRVISIPPPPLEERIVACQDCKHLLYKRDAQVVQQVSPPVCRYSAAGGRWIEESVTFAYYCPEHQKPYDHTEYDRTVKSVRYFRTVPAIPARLEEVFPGDHPEEK